MRLTDKRGWVTPIDSDTIAEIYKKLAAYEDAEEHGFLVTLPRDTKARIDVLEDLLRLSKMCLARKTARKTGV